MLADLKIYRGYANESEIIISGHLFKKKSPDRFALDQRKLKHAYAVYRMFTIKTIANAEIHLQFNTIAITTKTLNDGYFRFSIPYQFELKSGWHQFTVSTEMDGKKIEEKGEFIKPYPGEFGFISDIDDTFLISHSNNPLKKLYVLMSRNVERRKFFKGVVEHYQLLSQAGRKTNGENNAFFYVSSSEWNLYNLIDRFTSLHQFPKAVFKLKAIKSGLGDLLFTGGGSHDHKFEKIKHLLEFYPELQFILLGDDSQKDPDIYERIAKMFPKNVLAVYIRETRNGSKNEVQKIMNNIGSLNVEICYFKSSSEAIAHSKKIGLINN